jgi:hypothetical protein
MSTRGVPTGQPIDFVTAIPGPTVETWPKRRANERSGNLAARGGSRRGALSAEELIACALQEEKRTCFINYAFVEPLRRLVHSLNEEAELSAFGLRAAHFDIMRCLTNLLHLDAAEETEPRIARRPIDRPIFITGLPRSSTTFLHGILAQDPGNAVPRSWQLIYPYPFRNRLFGDWRKERVALQLGIYRFLAPRVAELHPMSADGPQECSDIVAHVFHSLRYDSMYHVPSYQDWIARRDHVDAYRFHKRFLCHLDRQQPGRRWILKSPDHVFALDAIRAVYPDALFVFLHRDPLPVLASQLNLTEALRRSFARHIDLQEIGSSVTDAIVDTADRLVASGKSRSVLHLDYRSVIAAPMEAVRRIYAHGGLALAPEASARMARWIARQQPRCARGNRRDLPAYGLDAGQVLARFDRYVQTFALAREQTFARCAA